MTSEFSVGQLFPRETALTRSDRRLPPGFPSQIRRQDAERGRGHAIEPTRLPHRPRSRGFELGAGFVGEARYRPVIDIAEDQPLVAAEGFDVGGLALEIDIVLGIDLEMDRDRWVNGRQFRPDAPDLRP